MKDEAIDTLIAAVYDAAVDTELWAGLAREIPLAFESTSISLIMIDKAGAGARFLLQSQNVTPDITRDYSAHFGKLDVWSQRGFELGTERVWSSRDMIDDRTFLHSEFYNDFIKRTDTAYVVGSIWDHSPGEICSFGIHRPLASGNYHDDMKTKVAQFAPHMKRASLLRDRLAPLELARKAALDTLELTGVSTFVVNADGGVVFANAQGEALLRNGDGLCLSAGRLTATNKHAAEKLSHLIWRATATSTTVNLARGATLAVARDTRLPLIVTIAPFSPSRHGLGLNTPCAILFVKDRESGISEAEAACSVYGLSAAETRLSLSLIRTGNLAQAAKDSKLTIGSARQYLKRIYSKTNTMGQVDFVTLILGTAK